MKDSKIAEETKAHYNDFPFDYLTPEDERNIEQIQPGAFIRFADAYLKPGMRVAEIGCGGGRGTLFMVRRGVNLLAADISRGSLQIARRRAAGRGRGRGPLARGHGRIAGGYRHFEVAGDGVHQNFCVLAFGVHLAGD